MSASMIFNYICNDHDHQSVLVSYMHTMKCHIYNVSLRIQKPLKKFYDIQQIWFIRRVSQ